MSTPMSFCPRRQDTTRVLKRGARPPFREVPVNQRHSVPKPVINSSQDDTGSQSNQQEESRRDYPPQKNRGRPFPPSSRGRDFRSQWTLEERREHYLKKKAEGEELETAKLQADLARLRNYMAKRDEKGAPDEEGGKLISVEQWKLGKHGTLDGGEESDDEDDGEPVYNKPTKQAKESTSLEQWNQEREETNLYKKIERLQLALAQKKAANKEKRLKEGQEQRDTVQQLEPNTSTSCEVIATGDAMKDMIRNEGVKKESEEEKYLKEKPKCHTCPAECGMAYPIDKKPYNYFKLAPEPALTPNAFLTDEYMANLPQEPSSSRDVATFILRMKHGGFFQYDQIGNVMIDLVERIRLEIGDSTNFEGALSFMISFKDKGSLPQMRWRDDSSNSLLRPVFIDGRSISGEWSGSDNLCMQPLIEILLEMTLMGHEAKVLLPKIEKDDVDDNTVLQRLTDLGLVSCLKDVEEADFYEEIEKRAEEVGAVTISRLEEELDSQYYSSLEKDVKEEELRQRNQLFLKDQFSLVIELIHFINLDYNCLYAVQMLLRFIHKEGLFQEKLNEFLSKNPPFLPPQAEKQNKENQQIDVNGLDLIEYCNLMGISTVVRQ